VQDIALCEEGAVMMKRTEEENFSDGRDFLRHGCGGEGQKRFFTLFPSFSRASPSWAGLNSRKSSILNVLPPSIRKEFSCNGCVVGDVVQQRRGVEILMGLGLRREGTNGRALRAAANRKAQS
jgi:hypothetical protein